MNACTCAAKCALAEALLAVDDTGGADDEAEKQLRSAADMDPTSPDPLQVRALLLFCRQAFAFWYTVGCACAARTRTRVISYTCKHANAHACVRNMCISCDTA